MIASASCETPSGDRPYSVRANQLPTSLQPREKFDRLGAEHLSESDLLALILRTGTSRLNVVQMAEHLLMQYGSLSRMAAASPTELAKTRGIGREKAKILKAALEIGRRLTQERIGERPRISTPEDVVAILRERARGLDREMFWVLPLDMRNRLLLPPIEVSRGTLNASLVHPREVFKAAVQHSAAAIIVAHNHPSGDPSPSANDLKITGSLIAAGKVMEIDVLDHVIIGQRRGGSDAEFFSLQESGLAVFA